jgi:hypothetical protein
VLGPTPADHAADAHIVRRVQERHLGAAVRHQASDVCRGASIPTEQLVVAEHPQVARLADCTVLQPRAVDIVLRVGGVLFKIGHKLIDLDCFEAEDRDIKAFRFQQPGQIRYFDRKPLTIPTRVLRNLVVSNRKGALFRRRKSRQHDDRHFREAEKLCCLVAALAGDERPVFIHQQWVGEAERGDAVCDLADLLGGMGPGITPIKFDLTDRQRLHRHIRGLELAARHAIGVFWHLRPLRRLLAITPPPARLNSHVHLPSPGIRRRNA